MPVPTTIPAIPTPTELSAMGLAWARVMPVVTLVPAFGLRALPTSARGVLAIALAAGIYPALIPFAQVHPDVPWYLLALEQVLGGLPIALAAAIPLWTATMAGGLVDSLRGAAQDGPGSPVIEGKAGAFGILLGTFASAVFLSTGGPARVVEAIARGDVGEHPLLAASHDLVAGITIAIAIGGPLLAAAVVLEVTFALIARASSPAQTHALFAPLRAIGLLAIMAIVLDRIGAAIATTVR